MPSEHAADKVLVFMVKIYSPEDLKPERVRHCLRNMSNSRRNDYISCKVAAIIGIIINAEIIKGFHTGFTRYNVSFPTNLSQKNA